MRVGNSDNAKDTDIKINICNAIYDKHIRQLTSVFNSNLDTNGDGRIDENDNLSGKYKKIAENLKNSFRAMVVKFSDYIPYLGNNEDPRLTRLINKDYEFTLKGISAFFADAAYYVIQMKQNTSYGPQIEEDFANDSEKFFTNAYSNDEESTNS